VLIVRRVERLGNSSIPRTAGTLLAATSAATNIIRDRREEGRRATMSASPTRSSNRPGREWELAKGIDAATEEARARGRPRDFAAPCWRSKLRPHVDAFFDKGHGQCR